MIKIGDPVWYYTGMRWGDPKRHGIVLFTHDNVVEVFSFETGTVEALFFKTKGVYWNKMC